MREMSVALAKKLAGLRVGNILMIGSSGSGKTTLMRAVEDLLAANPALASRSTVVRIHANVLGEEAEQGIRARSCCGGCSSARASSSGRGPVEELLEQAPRGLVFVDEVDKIRSEVGGQPNVPGIRAQEALLTLIENEAVPFALPTGRAAHRDVDSSPLLFVCAGAFEGLYDAVFYRVTRARTRARCRYRRRQGGRVREEMQFSLRDWLRPRISSSTA